MRVYGYCRCGERVERDEYREHVLTCPAHEENSDATNTVDAGSGTDRGGGVGPAEMVETVTSTAVCQDNRRYDDSAVRTEVCA